MQPGHEEHAVAQPDTVVTPPTPPMSAMQRVEVKVVQFETTEADNDGKGDEIALGLAAGDTEALPCQSEYVMLRMRLLDVSAM